jgi:hypothetical protein
VKRITALCADQPESQRVITALLELGIAENDISILVADEDGVRETDLEHKTLVPHGAAIGTATGAALGIGLVAVGGFPGLFAAGPALAILQGLGGGAAAGFITGALAGLSWWKSEADIPKELTEAGGVIVGAPISEDRSDAAVLALQAVGATRIYMS